MRANRFRNAEGKALVGKLQAGEDLKSEIDMQGLRILQSYAGNSLGNANPWQLTQIRRAVELGLGAKGPQDYAVIEVGTGRAARPATDRD